jgi:hypothetical protein
MSVENLPPAARENSEETIKERDTRVIVVRVLFANIIKLQLFCLD